MDNLEAELILLHIVGEQTLNPSSRNAFTTETL